MPTAPLNILLNPIRQTLQK